MTQSPNWCTVHIWSLKIRLLEFICHLKFEICLLNLYFLKLLMRHVLMENINLNHFFTNHVLPPRLMPQFFSVAFIFYRSLQTGIS